MNTDIMAVNELAVVRAGLQKSVAELRKQCEDSKNSSVALDKVQTVDVGVIWDSAHEVTGKELNSHITQVQKLFAEAGKQRCSLWNGLIEIYKTIGTLDSEYLSKIEKLLEQIHANYDNIKANNRDIIKNQEELNSHRVQIDELINGHETALKVLKQFKTKIDSLTPRLEEVDRTWDSINNENRVRIAAIEKANLEFCGKVEAIEKAVQKTDAKCDGIKAENQKDAGLLRDKIDAVLRDYDVKIRSLIDSKSRIDELKHIDDLDTIWDRVNDEIPAEFAKIKKQVGDVQTQKDVVEKIGKDIQDEFATIISSERKLKKALWSMVVFSMFISAVAIMLVLFG